MLLTAANIFQAHDHPLSLFLICLLDIYYFSVSFTQKSLFLTSQGLNFPLASVVLVFSEHLLEVKLIFRTD